MAYNVVTSEMQEVRKELIQFLNDFLIVNSHNIDEDWMPAADEALDPKFKRKWLADLRSGEFSQGRSDLFTQQGEDDGLYCCWGVAVRHIKDAKFQKTANNRGALTFCYHDYNSKVSLVDSYASEFSNIPELGTVKAATIVVLEVANDNGASFDLIARFADLWI